LSPFARRFLIDAGFCDFLKGATRGDENTLPGHYLFRHGSPVRLGSTSIPTFECLAVNRQLLYLEAEIGAPLFERLPSGMKLTPAGEVLARHSITVIQDAQRTASEFDNLRGVRRGKVTLITVEGVNSDLLPAVIGRMLQLHPMVEIEATTAGSSAIPPVVLSGDADIGLAFSLPRNENLQQRAVGKFRIGAAAIH
jgi:DNA-binding transcriptional LysR family regulator